MGEEVEPLTTKDRDRAFAMGPVIRMRVEYKRTRKEVGGNVFKRGDMIETEYVDKQALLDPSQSDMPLMIAMVRAGFYSAPEVELNVGCDFYTWRITDHGRAEQARLSRATLPQANNGESNDG